MKIKPNEVNKLDTDSVEVFKIDSFTDAARVLGVSVEEKAMRNTIILSIYEPISNPSRLIVAKWRHNSSRDLVTLDRRYVSIYEFQRTDDYVYESFFDTGRFLSYDQFVFPGMNNALLARAYYTVGQTFSITSGATSSDTIQASAGSHFGVIIPSYPTECCLSPLED